MNTSATYAKARLLKMSREKISYEEWLKRVAEALAIGGLKLTDLPEYPYRSWYGADMRAGRVAEVILKSHEAVRK